MPLPDQKTLDFFHPARGSIALVSLVPSFGLDYFHPAWGPIAVESSGPPPIVGDLACDVLSHTLTTAYGSVMASGALSATLGGIATLAAGTIIVSGASTQSMGGVSLISAAGVTTGGTLAILLPDTQTSSSGVVAVAGVISQSLAGVAVIGVLEVTGAAGDFLVSPLSLGDVDAGTALRLEIPGICLLITESNTKLELELTS